MHTPGPWEAALEKGCHGVIAKVLPEGANFVAIVGNDKATPEREPARFANARLIAAAPELLEALESLVDSHTVREAMRKTGRREEIDAVIAKARGE